MADDAPYLAIVPAIEPVHLFHQPSIALRQARVQPITFAELPELRQADACVKVIGACSQDVPARARSLVGHHWVD